MGEMPDLVVGGQRRHRSPKSRAHPGPKAYRGTDGRLNREVVMSELELLGTKIGNIRIVDSLGEGGMGSVFVGVDEKLHRRVALKAIKQRYRLDSVAKARFLREARILSQLQHPHICQIYDFVELDGNEFLILELVAGESLRGALKAGIDQSMAMSICEQLLGALMAAHDKGVIHRDINPNNIMLTSAGEVKVLDFGLACSVDPENVESEGDSIESGSDLDRSGATDSEPEQFKTTFGSIVGTVGYMSPEQARGEPATPASDMYSFGLIAQELFTGQPPLDRKLPKRARLVKVSQGETNPVTGLDADLTRLINRLKSLAPGARPSAVDTGGRLRWIRGRAKRRVKRVLAVAAIAVSMVVAAVMSFQAMRIAQEARRANREAEAARQVSDFMIDLFKVSDPTVGKRSLITASELLDRGTERITTELADQPLIRARLLDAIGEVNLNLGQFDKAEPLFTQALELRRKHLGEDHLEVADSLHGRAEVVRLRGNYAEAEQLLLQALAIRQLHAAANHPDVDLSLEQVDSVSSGDDPESGRRRAVAIVEIIASCNLAGTKRDLTTLGSVYFRQGRLVEAGVVFSRALEITQGTKRPKHKTLARDLNNLAAVYRRVGRLHEAETLFRRSLAVKEKHLAPDHFDIAHTLNNLAIVYSTQGRYDQAEPLYRRALKIKEKVWGGEHPKVSSSLYNLAVNFRLQGKYSEAEPLFRRDLEISERTLGPDHPFTSEGLKNLAQVCTRLGRYGEAAQLLDRCQASCERRFLDEPSPANRSLLADIYNGRGELHQAQADDEAARKAWNRAIEVIQPISRGSQVPDVKGIYAAVLLHLGRIEEAEPLVESLLAEGWGGEEFRQLCSQHGLLSL